MTKWILIGAFVLLSFATQGCKLQKEQPETLVVYAAASLTDVLQKVAQEFEQSHDSEIVFNFAGSGTLAQQIIAYPRADLFISANQQWMDKVGNAGCLFNGSLETVLENQLVVVANKSSDFHLATLSGLPALDYTYLAIGDPASVPAGRYAKAWLESVIGDDGISFWETFQGHLSYASDVRAALAQTLAKRDVIAIVYRTDWMARRGELSLLYEVPLRAAPRINYTAAVIAQGEHVNSAKTFLQFMKSRDAAVIFEQYGFIVSHRDA